MIGIKKQTDWYLDRSKKIDVIREEINPFYGLVCRLSRQVNKWIYESIWFVNIKGYIYTDCQVWA